VSNDAEKWDVDKAV